MPNFKPVLLFSLYFAIGFFIVKDYGISTDEIYEHETSLSNYVYVMGKGMSTSQSEKVKNAVNDTPDLITHHDRFYGAALQDITVLIEHLFGFELPSRDVFLLRHAFTFLNYFIAGIFFYLILHRRFGNTLIPLLGALFYILYPRFFGESFYNIKDIMFFSWYVISTYFVLRWLESKGNSFLLFAAASLAIATNTRILGVSVLLLACVFAFATGARRKALMLIALTFICYIVITPFTWENPLKNTVDTFLHLMYCLPWNGTHFYMGEMITRNVPWHYIPVWMGLTVPLLYIVMFFVGVAAIVVAGSKFLAGKFRSSRSAVSPHLFDVFFAALFFCTLLGFICLHVSMYEGWRHAYGIYASFLYIAVLGLERSFAFTSGKRMAIRYGFACVVAAYMIYLSAWITVNHPYQYVYFNMAGRQFAEKNFTLDYWDVSFMDLIRYALANDDRPKIIFAVNSVSSKPSMLKESEKERVVWSNMESADYYIQDTRIPYKERFRPYGFTELNAITVDGMKISRLYKRVRP